MMHRLEVEVFRAGDYGAKGRWGEEDLDRIAGDYDPALHEAPVTLDHAQRGPALGWVEAIRRVGDRLVARLRLGSDRLLELIRSGAFRKRSVEIYPALRETGRPYLRAVSFLGAAAPEVKGLADPLPAAGAAALFAEGETPHETFDEELPAATDGLTEGAAGDAAGNDATGDATGEASVAEMTERTVGAAGTARLEALTAKMREAGKWDPAWDAEGLARFCDAIAGLPEALDWFCGFMEGLRPVVAMGEAAAAKPAGEDDPLVRFGESVDPDSLALHRTVLEFQRRNPGTSYGEALRRCA